MRMLTQLNFSQVGEDGKILTDRESRAIRKFAVRKVLKSRKGIRINYLRDRRRQQYGVVVSEKVGDTLHVGWSMVHDEDETVYDKNYGILFAMNRMEPLDKCLRRKKLPNDVRNFLKRMPAAMWTNEKKLLRAIFGAG